MTKLASSRPVSLTFTAVKPFIFKVGKLEVDNLAEETSKALCAQQV